MVESKVTQLMHAETKLSMVLMVDSKETQVEKEAETTVNVEETVLEVCLVVQVAVPVEWDPQVVVLVEAAQEVLVEVALVEVAQVEVEWAQVVAQTAQVEWDPQVDPAI